MPRLLHSSPLPPSPSHCLPRTLGPPNSPSLRTIVGATCPSTPPRFASRCESQSTRNASTIWFLRSTETNCESLLCIFSTLEPPPSLIFPFDAPPIPLITFVTSLFPDTRFRIELQTSSGFLGFLNDTVFSPFVTTVLRTRVSISDFRLAKTSSP